MFNKLSSMALIQARLVLRDLTCLKEMLNGLINSTQKLQNIHDNREKNRGKELHNRAYYLKISILQALPIT